jgi:hypothetical protein
MVGSWLNTREASDFTHFLRFGLSNELSKGEPESFLALSATIAILICGLMAIVATSFMAT